MQPVQIRRCLFQFEQGNEFAINEFEVKHVAAADEDAADVEPILIAPGKGFVYDKIICGTGPEFAFSNIPKRRSANAAFLEGKCSKSDI
jgi:hypothetical protein